MKSLARLFFCSTLLVFFITSNAQTLFSYGKKTVSKDEFIKAFSKNNTNEKFDEKALREYLDLYAKFKLKVQAAYDLKMDTLDTQRAELQGFRSQLVQSYMNDQGSLNALVNEAFQRSQKDIRIAHIFIPAKEGDSINVIAKAKKQIDEAYKQLQQGKDFASVALQFSKDPSVKQNKGELGYITVFSLPYSLENLAYGTTTGKFSPPLQTKAGFHIFKKLGERKAVGKIQVAQILLAFPPGGSEAGKLDVRKRADSILTAISGGADFGDMAATFSNDNFSYLSNGELPEFGVGRYDAAFEQAAFSLSKDGEISKPVLTEYGYHLIKRIKHIPVQSDKKNTEYFEQLQQNVLNDTRVEVSRAVMLQKILRLSGYKKGVFNENQLWAYTDSTIGKKPVPEKTTIRPNTILFSFTKQNILVKDWIAFRTATQDPERINLGKANKQLLEYYAGLAGTEYYKNHLEDFNQEFAYQMKEFKDGNLLFEIMQKNVWDKAVIDSAGLKKYYQSNQGKYWWQPSVTGILFSASDDSTAKVLHVKLKDSINNWRKILESFEGNIIADSGRFEIEQLSLPANYSVRLNTFSEFIRNPADSSLSFIYITHHFPQRSPRNYEDARGYVINDYQTYLEELWIEELKKKYPIKLNEVVFKSILK